MGQGKEKLKTEYDSLLGKDIQNQGHRQEGKPSGIPCIDVLNELSEDGRLDRAIWLEAELQFITHVAE